MRQVPMAGKAITWLALPHQELIVIATRTAGDAGSTEVLMPADGGDRRATAGGVARPDAQVPGGERS